MSTVRRSNAERPASGGKRPIKGSNRPSGHKGGKDRQTVASRKGSSGQTKASADASRSGMLSRLVSAVLSVVLMACVGLFLILMACQTILEPIFLVETLESAHLSEQKLEEYGVDEPLSIVPMGVPDGKAVLLQPSLTVERAVELLAEAAAIDPDPVLAVLDSPAVARYLVSYWDGCLRMWAGTQELDRPSVVGLQQALRGQADLVATAYGRALTEEEWQQVDAFAACYTESLVDLLAETSTWQGEDGTLLRSLSRLLLHPSWLYCVLGVGTFLLLLLVLVQRWWPAALGWGGIAVFTSGLLFWILNFVAGILPSLLVGDMPLLSTFLRPLATRLTRDSFLWGVCTMTVGAALLLLYGMMRYRREKKRW